MDALSDVLRSVRLTGGVFLDARFTAPWSINSQTTAEYCEPYLAAPAQIIAYHVVIAGRLQLSVEGEAAIEVMAGEIVLVPRNEVHTLSSVTGLKPLNAQDLILPAGDGGLMRIRHGGGGAATHIVCGFLASEDAYNPLIETLPRVMKLDIRDGTARDWIEASVRFAAGELVEGRLASSSVMSRLSELLFVEAVRHYSATLGSDELGWLKGLRDPQVGRALALMHRTIAAPWTADSLAREVALSRSAFMDRFRTLVGMPPIRYLTMWRLRTAKLNLRESGRSVSQVAHEVGYDSEEAFSRAFKREFGVSPTRWRDQDAGAEGPSGPLTPRQRA
ncbi:MULTISPECIES: AraC family transcriptional regulator [Rhodopseudomonas]|uniref:AraC family transcriptional regulator n=1 Tax=Rhodopseudomonas TaxID=1073 RepID=UPI0005C87BC3|nr:MULTISPECIES: AraC family transcriptional regulator [Rhodopseudomonas]MDF3810417.1 AraC family transcriptional regulator [Rhodopseudomonas sp. BAL398]WOK19603.1 AraC family transcriptional regulator [Rhodopseudomonas sp. BAL398]